jgi:endonuclease-8
MPEGPSIVILKEAVQQFSGHTIISVSGNSRIGIERIKGQTVISFKSWGKHFLICFEEFTIRIHLLMFGTYRINERKDKAPQLNLTFSNGEINFYSCSIKFLEGNVNLHYDWTADVMNENWNPKSAKKKLQMIPDQMICDALLDQNIFAGVGNIIKNEVLYKTYVHPESLVGKVPLALLKKIIDECSKYSFDFFEWKKNFVLRDHWLVYTKKICQRCNLPIQHKKYMGVRKRRSFYCPNCQKLYQ